MRRAMTRYVFEEIGHRASKVVKCAGCGKALRRARTFTMTQNPWNVNAAGLPASREEIREKLRVKATAWLGEPENCTACLRRTLRPSA
jgi:hypothetical protein